MSPLLALSSAWRRYRPRVDLEAGSRAVVQALQGGRSLGEALAEAGPRLAQVAVSEAAGKFEGGALALFIVDVRDSLRRQLELAGRRSGDTLIIGALRGVSTHVAGDTFVQHLINTLLEATGLYVEAQVVERLDERRCARAVAELLARSQCVLISRTDAARRLGERMRRVSLSPWGEGWREGKPS